MTECNFLTTCCEKQHSTEFDRFSGGAQAHRSPRFQVFAYSLDGSCRAATELQNTF